MRNNHLRLFENNNYVGVAGNSFQRRISSQILFNYNTYYTPKHKKLVDKAIARIEKNGFKDYTIISLAKEIESNETTLKYAFKSIMRITPYKFFQYRRMAAA